MYKVIVLEKVVKYLKNLDGAIVQKIWAGIRSLQDNPRPKGCVKLTDRSEYRIRVGNYRVLYLINDKELEVLVIRVGDRKEIYD